MDFFSAVKNRLSYRGAYSDRPVPEEDLVKIVKTAVMAPSGKNAQTTEFLIVNDSALVNAISTLHHNNQAMQHAKAYIFCIVDKNPQPVYHNYSFQLEDCAAAVQNMLLAITALGYASVWIDGWLRIEDNHQRTSSIVGLPPEKKIQVILPVGVPVQEQKRPEKKGFDQRVKFNNFYKKNI